MTRYYLFALLLVTLTSQANAPQQGDTVKQHRSNSQQPAASSNANAVSFTWQAPNARQVFLAGEMNDWQADTLPMVKNDQGQWQLTVYLEPGRWSYKFVQDGMWLTDERNPLKHSDAGREHTLLVI